MWRVSPYSSQRDGLKGRLQFREVYWAREVDWLITTPLLLLDLALLAGMAPLDIASLLIADIFMILFGFVAALDSGVRTRWIPYTISVGPLQSFLCDLVN
jgi:bacteriorhodopsin